MTEHNHTWKIDYSQPTFDVVGVDRQVVCPCGATGIRKGKTGEVCDIDNNNPQITTWTYPEPIQQRRQWLITQISETYSRLTDELKQRYPNTEPPDYEIHMMNIRYLSDTIQFHHELTVIEQRIIQSKDGADDDYASTPHPSAHHESND